MEPKGEPLNWTQWRKWQSCSDMCLSQQNGWKLHGNSKEIWLTKGEHEVIFDIIIPTNKGLLFSLYFWREMEIAGAMADGVKTKQMMANEAHDKFGHADDAATQKAAKEQGVKIVRGNMKPCAACTLSERPSKRLYRKLVSTNPCHK
jgi:hypothetical protein